jgi:phytoene dehydrogenase-like protein
MIDAAVLGSGPNGLVAANLLADRGWRVTVFEEQEVPGGAVRSAQVTLPGYTHDLFSAFYPLAVASPAIRGLEVERWGVRWRRSPAAVAHPLPDGSCALLSLDAEETAASLDAYAPGDGERWHELISLWDRVGPGLLQALMTPFPPLRAGARIAAALRGDLVRFVRFGILPVRRLAHETFRGAGGGNLLAGNALHADFSPESAGSGLFGWLLGSLGQRVGFPVPEGGAGRLSEALVRRLSAAGGEVVCGRRVTAIVVRRGRAVGVRLDDGADVAVRRAVLAATGAPQLYLDLLARDAVPPTVVRDMERFEYDTGTVKLDWALSAPIPWSAPGARRAGTIHVAEGIDALTETTSQVVRGLLPARPYLVLGQYAMVDPTRAPPGAETAWAYTHVPRTVRGDAGGELGGGWDAADADGFAARMEEEVERLAPGFRSLIRARHMQTPAMLQAANRNLDGGAINGGTAQLHQQLVLRPAPGLGRPETPVRGLYLASASAHPGGGVHGGPGANAARVALAHDRARRVRAASPARARGRGPRPAP